MRVLAGDIGGTNARLAIVDVAEGEARLVREAHYRSHDFPGLPAIVARFLSDAGERPERAAFGVAGRVVDGVARPPNLPWVVSATELTRAARLSHVAVVNDFDAIGHGLPYLAPRDITTLQAGEPIAHGAIALIGPGTGLGEGLLLWDGARYRVHASEGGHVTFAPRDEREWGLARALATEFGHVSYERVLSGPGLAHLYRYLATTGVAPEAAPVRHAMRAEDPAAVITRHALADDDPLCVETVALFVSLLGAQAGDLALTAFATGGVFVAGGIAPRIVAKLRDGPFLTSFRCKGRLSEFLGRVPVHVILNPKVGLLGAAAAAAAAAAR